MLIICSSVDIYSSHEGQLYCKPHFRELFKPKAVVDEDFELRKLILCFVDRVFRYICVMETNLIHYLSSVHFVSQPLHVSGIFVAHHQEAYCIYTTVGTCRAFQLTECIAPDDGLQICPKQVEVD